MADRATPAVTWKVGSRRCTLTARRCPEPGVMEVEIEWAPSLPGRLTEQELQEYIAGRDRALRWIGAIDTDNPQPQERH